MDKKPKTVCLIVGHSVKEGGAVNRASGTTEYFYNSRLGAKIWALFAAEAKEKIVDLRPVIRGAEDSSMSETLEMVERINLHEPDLVVSLHANAVENHDQNGHCVLYWKGSKTGAQLAMIFMGHIKQALENPDRGIRGRDDLIVMKHTICKTLVLEPFFIDHDGDYQNAETRINRLAFHIYEAIRDVVETGAI